ncbi:carbonic anhydrase [Mucilaginibacter sp. AW1-3]
MKKKVVLTMMMALWAIIPFACNEQNPANENKEKQSQTVDDSHLDPLSKLKTGNKRFYTGQAVHLRQDSTHLKQLVTGQKPFAVIVSCSDSRVPPEEVFDQGLGDVFSIRTAGNVISDFELGSIEYAVEHLGTTLIIVLGHDECGAVKAFLDHENDSNVPGHIKDIVQAIKNEPEETEALKTRSDLLARAVKANIQHDVKQLQDSEPILKETYQKRKITIIGAVYHLNNGQVEFF